MFCSFCPFWPLASAVSIFPVAHLFLIFSSLQGTNVYFLVLYCLSCMTWQLIFNLLCPISFPWTETAVSHSDSLIQSDRKKMLDCTGKQKFLMSSIYKGLLIFTRCAHLHGRDIVRWFIYVFCLYYLGVLNLRIRNLSMSFSRLPVPVQSSFESVCHLNNKGAFFHSFVTHSLMNPCVHSCIHPLTNLLWEFYYILWG